MYIYCYLSYASAAIQERIWAWVQSQGGWLSIRAVGIEYYVPETSAYSMLLLLDPEIKRLVGKDYLA